MLSRTGTRACIAACATLLLVAACGSKHYILRADYPTEPMTLEPETGLAVWVAGVEDARTFEKDVEAISVPCIWDDPPAEDVYHIVGARGDSLSNLSNIYLADEQRVDGIVEDLIEVALRQAGYDLAESEDEADLVAEATIEEFWVWMSPGPMTIRVESRVQVTVVLTGEGVEEELEVSGYHDSADVAKSPESFQFALDEALHDLYTHVATAFIQLDVEPGSPAPE